MQVTRIPGTRFIDSNIGSTKINNRTFMDLRGFVKRRYQFTVNVSSCKKTP